MPDQADIQKNILIQIATNQAEITGQLVELNSELIELQENQKKVAESTGKASSAYVENDAKVRQLKQSIRDKNKELDNSAKAIIAENNSLQQNRALLSVLTQQYVKLGLEEGRTAKSTIELGNQINALSQKIVKQEEVLNQHQRKVGDYQGAMERVIAGIGGKYIPGFSQFSSIIQTTAQNFGQVTSTAAKTEEGLEGVGEGAAGAEAGLAGAGAIAFGVTAAFVGVGVALVGLYEYFDQFSSFSDIMSAKWAGLKAGTESFFQTLFSGNWGSLFSNMSTASLVAEALALHLKDLARQMEVVSVKTQAEDIQIRNLMLRMRDRTASAAQAEQDFQKILQLTGDQYKTNHGLAVDAYNSAVLLGVQKSNLTSAQEKSIVLNVNEKMTIDQLSQAYETAAVNAKKLVDAGLIDKDVLKTVTDGLSQIQQTDGLKLNRDQMAQNRADQRAAREAQAKEREAQKEQADLQKREEIERELEQIDSERKASITKTLEFQMDALAKELSALDESYRQKLFKLDEFIKKQEEIINNPKSSAKTRSVAGQAITGAKADQSQIRKEQYSAQEKALVDHNKEMINQVEQYNLANQTLRDKAIGNNYDRTAKGYQDDLAQQEQAISVENAKIQETINQLNKEIENTNGRYNAEEIVSLKRSLDAQISLISDNDDKKVQLEKDTQQKLRELKEQFNNQQANNIDQANVDNADNPSHPNSKAEYQAKVQQLNDEQAQATDAANKQTVEGQVNTELIRIHAEFLQKKKALDNQYNQGWKGEALSITTAVTDSAFQIIDNGIKARAEAELSSLQLQTDTELKNTALTTTQRSIIQEQQRKKEQQIKRAEFYSERKEGITKATIQGAIAVLKAAPDIPLEILTAAETALQIGVIAAQQPPPAYATGGVHYTSTGTGSLVRGAGNGKSDSINARISHGESIINANSTSRFGPLLSAINVAGGGVPFDVPNFSGKFATGGIISGANYIPTAATGLHPDGIGIRLHADDIAGIASAISSQPAPIVDVKDINYMQQTKATVDNRLIL